jgi:uncharacterized protein
MLDLIAKETNLNPRYVANVIQLLEEGATIPFISRYRKEMTGEMDEVQIAQIQMTKTKHDMISRRKEIMLKTIEELGVLTPELKNKIESTFDLVALDDIYLPYKPKRKTRATDARDKGLEPLAKLIFAQQERDPETRAAEFVTDKVKDTDDALKGARDIIAEWINENEQVRTRIRNIFTREAILRSAVVRTKEEDGVKYKDYYKWEEPLAKAPSHRVLALLRGEDESFLRVYIEIDPDKAHETISHLLVKGKNGCSAQMEEAIEESYKRLIQPSMETEFRSAAKEKADIEAIRVFAENMRQLLLSAPLGQKRIMAIDPGFKSGCKVVCLDAQGNLVHTENIYPHPPQNDQAMAMKKISTMVESYDIEAIAIGNGTAGRETEQFIARIKFNSEVKVFVVSEAGASIYSASSVAREEFPEYDVTVRGSVSIGRRLMDPLAELVKIEPKSIGVGQYQHDVDQSLLKQELDRVVESCVNKVGVELNTASKHLLAYVSGLGESIADKIVQYRKEHGAFKTRAELLKVPRLGEKAYEQAAGFLRIADSQNPLDNSAVHPEAYGVVEKMAKSIGSTVKDLVRNEELIKKIDPKLFIDTKFGAITIGDIIKELSKPSRDPRKMAKVFEFDSNVRTMEDLREGMVLPGIVTNITNFGAFVDIGVKQDGLVHISHLADKFVSDPYEAVSLHQHVKVKVMEVDIARKRVGLSIKEADQSDDRPSNLVNSDKKRVTTTIKVTDGNTLEDLAAKFGAKVGKLKK